MRKLANMVVSKVLAGAYFAVDMMTEYECVEC